MPAASASPVHAVRHPSPKAPAQADVAFGIQPASHGKPDARARLAYSMTPGASASDEVALVNLGTKPVTLSVYATDATSGADGSFGLLAAAQKPADLGRWITVGGRNTVRVPARTSHGPSYVIVPIRLSAPGNATPGDHAGGVVVSLLSSAVNKQGLKIGFDQRVGMRVYTRISGRLRAGLAVEDLKVSYAAPAVNGNPFADGTATVIYRVHNTGNLLLGATQSISVMSWLGGTAHAATPPTVPALLPGASVAVTQRVTEVFPGLKVTATVRLHPRAPSGSADPKVADVSRSTSLCAVPWSLLGSVLVLLAVLVLVIRHARRQRAGASGRHSQGGTVR